MRPLYLSNGIGLVVWVCLMISIGDVTRGQSPGPNAVVSINGQTWLDCQTSILAGSTWSFTTDGSNNPLLIAVGCAVTGSNAVYYSTTHPGGNICRLIIANATMQQAGVYDCAAGSGGVAYRSLVTVIDPVASVIVYNQSEVVENDQLNISCSISYTGPVSPAPLLRPLPSWTTSPGQSFTSSKYDLSTNIVTLVATVTVKKPTVPIFQCNTAFEVNGSSSLYNLTAPQDNFLVGNTIPLDVQYYPTSTTITSTVSTTDKCVYKQESLTCAADANPPAQYEWLDLSNNIKTIGSVRSISSGGQYQCIAHNVIRSLRFNDTKIASEATCYSPYNLTMGGSNCANSSCSCPHKLIPVSLSCTADGYPKPTIHWWSDVPEMEDLGNNPTIEVIIDGNYNCTASNAYGGQPYIATASMSVTKCPRLYCLKFKELYICIIVIILPTYFGFGGIFGVLFVIHIWKTREQEENNFLTRFPILRKMLSCMNIKELAKKREEELAKKKEEELAKKREEELAKKREEELAQKREEELAKKREEELAKKREEELAKKREEELAKKRDPGPPEESDPTTKPVTVVHLNNCFAFKAHFGCTSLSPVETTPPGSILDDALQETPNDVPKQTSGSEQQPAEGSEQQPAEGSEQQPAEDDVPKQTLSSEQQPAEATPFERCLWITLYIVMVITVGVFVIPTMLLMVYCCPSKGSKEDNAENNRQMMQQ